MSNLKPCIDCGRTMRHARHKAADYPDVVTVCAGSADRCTTCHRKHLDSNQAKRPEAPTLGDLKLEQNLASLGSFMARRQQRLGRRQLGGVA